MLLKFSCRVWHDNYGSNPDWYLNHIIIRDLQNDAVYYFICHNWFSIEKSDQKVSTLLSSKIDLVIIQEKMENHNKHYT